MATGPQLEKANTEIAVLRDDADGAQLAATNAQEEAARLKVGASGGEGGRRGCPARRHAVEARPGSQHTQSASLTHCHANAKGMHAEPPKAPANARKPSKPLQNLIQTPCTPPPTANPKADMAKLAEQLSGATLNEQQRRWGGDGPGLLAPLRFDTHGVGPLSGGPARPVCFRLLATPTAADARLRSGAGAKPHTNAGAPPALPRARTRA